MKKFRRLENDACATASLEAEGNFQPQFTIAPSLLKRTELITALREGMLAATVQVPWTLRYYAALHPCSNKVT
jgi:hypothetical protein